MSVRSADGYNRRRRKLWYHYACERCRDHNHPRMLERGLCKAYPQLSPEIVQLIFHYWEGVRGFGFAVNFQGYDWSKVWYSCQQFERNGWWIPKHTRILVKGLKRWNNRLYAEVEAVWVPNINFRWNPSELTRWSCSGFLALHHLSGEYSFYNWTYSQLQQARVLWFFTLDAPPVSIVELLGASAAQLWTSMNSSTWDALRAAQRNGEWLREWHEWASVHGHIVPPDITGTIRNLN